MVMMEKCFFVGDIDIDNVGGGVDKTNPGLHGCTIFCDRECNKGRYSGGVCGGVWGGKRGKSGRGKGGIMGWCAAT